MPAAWPCHTSRLYRQTRGRADEGGQRKKARRDPDTENDAQHDQRPAAIWTWRMISIGWLRSTATGNPAFSRRPCRLRERRPGSRVAAARRGALAAVRAPERQWKITALAAAGIHWREPRQRIVPRTRDTFARMLARFTDVDQQGTLLDQAPGVAHIYRRRRQACFPSSPLNRGNRAGAGWRAGSLSAGRRCDTRRLGLAPS